ncbi:hypothetical protein HUT19_33945 [Streptomyces sp. NA02950]|uniref:hypothetical protein n=1 Tax=Streptomyces sp. NA02950 TaxID=2742137 RepID=UPI0015918D2C|nr:hypothetical protein [Streptomyces sp. NA02950]QKV96111.1 hypothetical protein HUT19_33945 [Streptomyces sp. NA02950]
MPLVNGEPSYSTAHTAGNETVFVIRQQVASPPSIIPSFAFDRCGLILPDQPHAPSATP